MRIFRDRGADQLVEHAEGCGLDVAGQQVGQVQLHLQRVQAAAGRLAGRLQPLPVAEQRPGLFGARLLGALQRVAGMGFPKLGHGRIT